jgi:hypothetical protein
MIGMGMCMNATMICGKMIVQNQILFTAQDYGCVGHEPGEQTAGIESSQEVRDVRREFIANILGKPENL